MVTDDLGLLSDRELVQRVMEVLTTPPSEPADSFVLHAPLELARAELLPSVDPSGRADARRRIAEIATEWVGRSPHVATPAPPTDASLFEALATGDVEAADGALVALAAAMTPDQFVAAAGSALLPHLGGAGHLAIFLDQLTRLRRAPAAAIASGRALVRDLARHPDWEIRWLDGDLTARSNGPARSFTDVLANPPAAGPLESNFIHPTMDLVDSNGMAAELLAHPTATVPVDEARRQLLRIAAMAMLQDDPAHAPYGWSHCLTMPQAALAVASRTANPHRAVAVAATYVLGFRATLSATAIDLDWTPPRRPAGGPLLDADPADAVAEAWHTEQPHLVERELATYAARHHDAHLAKYTLACFHAAHDDPAAAGLFRAAAARLALWWRDSA